MSSSVTSPSPPGHGQLLVRMRASTICGSDIASTLASPELELAVDGATDGEAIGARMTGVGFGAP